MTRRAVTLVELMVVIFLTTLALGTVAILLRGALVTNNATQTHRTMVQSLQRLAMQFREDVHAAESIETGGDRLTIRLPSGAAIEYALSGQTLERTEPVEADQTRHDGFELPAGATVEFAAERIGDMATESDAAASRNELVSLAIEFPAGAEADTATRRFKIEAAHRGN